MIAADLMWSHWRAEAPEAVKNHRRAGAIYYLISCTKFFCPFSHDLQSVKLNKVRYCKDKTRGKANFSEMPAKHEHFFPCGPFLNNFPQI